MSMNLNCTMLVSTLPEATNARCNRTFQWQGWVAPGGPHFGPAAGTFDSEWKEVTIFRCPQVREHSRN